MHDDELKFIELNENNVKYCLQLSTYFLLKNAETIVKHIINKYVLQCQFYDKIYMLNYVNIILINIIEKWGDTENNPLYFLQTFPTKTLEYLHSIDNDLLKNITKINFGNKITQNFVENFINLKTLHLYKNKNITDLNILTNLEFLNIDQCLIGQNGISNLFKLKTFCVLNNQNIKNINHMQLLENLKILDYEFSEENKNNKTNITNKGISELKNIKNLNIRNNTKITNINHLEKIEELDISGIKCVIKQRGISKLKNLTKINVSSNKNITNLNMFEKLEEINMCDNKTIIFENMSRLVNIKHLKISNDGSMLNQFRRFNTIVISDDSSDDFDDESDDELHNSININNTNINNANIHETNNVVNINDFIISDDSSDELDNNNTQLFTTNNNRNNNNFLPYNVNIFQKLKQLKTHGLRGLSQTNIMGIQNLIHLDISNNPNIHNLNHLKTLTYLDISRRCKIDYDGITDLCNLKILIFKQGNSCVNLNGLENLQILKICKNNCVVDNDILNLKKLKELHALSIPNKIMLNHLKSLEYLDISCRHYKNEKNNGIDQECISELANLKVLKINGNKHIKHILQFTKLQRITVDQDCEIDKQEFKSIDHLKILHIKPFND